MANVKTTDETDLRILTLVREVVPWQFAKKEIRPEMSLQRDLGIDSMGKASLVFGLEEEFGIDITGVSIDVSKVLTVNDVLEITKELMNGTKGE